VHAEATGHSQKVETRPYKVMKMLIIRGGKNRGLYIYVITEDECAGPEDAAIPLGCPAIGGAVRAI
jgi:hypothetical protein